MRMDDMMYAMEKVQRDKIMTTTIPGPVHPVFVGRNALNALLVHAFKFLYS